MDSIDKKEFMHLLWRYKRGSITRRHFLGASGLGVATAVLAQAMPWLAAPKRAHAAGELGDRLAIATWPNYYDPANYEKFTADTGVQIDVAVFGSNEEMIAKMQAGGTGWDVIVPTNYTIADYVKLGMIEPLDTSKLPNFVPSAHDQRFIGEGTVDGKVYAVPKDWGTTGYYVNTSKVTEKMTTWKEFWDLLMTKYTGRGTVHDYQLTTIGNALKYYGYSFNSVDPKELADAEQLLMKAKPHLFAIDSNYQGVVRSGDAWLGICWTGDAIQLRRDMKEVEYVIGREGGEIWTDFYVVTKDAPHREAAYAFINYLLDPTVNAKEVLAHGYPSTDKRVTELLPPELVNDPVLYPAAELLTNLEFGAAGLATNAARAEIMARFKAA
jgi:spermidine/putrescine transport system substrate-binding protein